MAACRDVDTAEHRGSCRETSEADRNNRYAIARGEAMECGAIIDVLRLIEAVPEPELTAAKELLVRVVGMLSKMCR